MAKKKARSRFISVDDHEKYSRSSGGKYFKLVDDGDSAKVRFMFRKPEDVKVCGATVHSLEINGAYPTVRCIKAYEEPKDACPLCREGYDAKLRYFVPIYNIDADKVQIFSNRGPDFVKMIARKAVRYAKKGEVAQCIFELIRNGEKGSLQTTYDAEFDDKDNTTLDDLPDYEEVLDSVILDKSEDDMEYFIESGEFPPEDEVKPRRGKKAVEEDDDDDYDDYDEDDDEIDDDDEEDEDDDDEEDEEDEDDDFDEEEDDDEDEDDEDEDDDLEDEDEEDEDERPVRKSASKAKSKAVQRRVPAKKGKRK